MSTKTLEHYMSLDYPVEVRKVPEELGKGYSACIPSLGRWTFYAEGESEVEALAELQEVKRSLFEHFIGQGKAIPLPPPSPEWGGGRMSTKIPWCDQVWDITGGCTKTGTGCEQCFAARLAATRLAHLPRYQGLAYRTADGGYEWTGEVRLYPDRLNSPIRRRKPTTYFVCSKSDLFHEAVPEEFIDQVFAVMALAPRHCFILLTKRTNRMEQYFNGLDKRVLEWDSGEGETEELLIKATLNSYEGSKKIESACYEWLSFYNARHMGWPLRNVWLGVSVSTQEEADEKIPILLEIPAAVRFVSAEPILSAVDLRPWLADLGWLIVGTESGSRRRPAELDWFRSLRDQCIASDTPFFLKSMELGGKVVNMPELDSVVWDQFPGRRQG